MKMTNSRPISVACCHGDTLVGRHRTSTDDIWVSAGNLLGNEVQPSAASAGGHLDSATQIPSGGVAILWCFHKTMGFVIIELNLAFKWHVPLWTTGLHYRSQWVIFFDCLSGLVSNLYHLVSKGIFFWFVVFVLEEVRSYLLVSWVLTSAPVLCKEGHQTRGRFGPLYAAEPDLDGTFCSFIIPYKLLGAHGLAGAIYSALSMSPAKKINPDIYDK